MASMRLPNTASRESHVSYLWFRCDSRFARAAHRITEFVAHILDFLYGEVLCHHHFQHSYWPFINNNCQRCCKREYNDGHLPSCYYCCVDYPTDHDSDSDDHHVDYEDYEYDEDSFSQNSDEQSTDTDSDGWISDPWADSGYEEWTWE